MFRLLLENVTLIKEREIILHVRFEGGATKIRKIPLLSKGWRHALTIAEIEKVIDNPMDRLSYLDIAEVQFGEDTKDETLPVC